MDRIIEITFLILYGLSYIEPHLKKLRKRIERFLKPFYKAVLVALKNAIRKITNLFMSREGPLVIIVSILLWLDSLLYVAGIGRAYDLYGRTIKIAFVCFLYQWFLKKRFPVINSSTFLIFMWLILDNAYTTIRFNQNYLEYAAIYCIVIVYSIWSVSKKQMFIISLLCGIAGGAVLAVANYTKFFAGWDGNTVSNVAFFGYTVFAAGFANIRNKKYKIFLIIYSCVYFIWLQTLGARNAMLFSILLMLCVFKIIPLKKLLTEKSILFILLIPLIIAVLVVLVTNMPFVDHLNLWSIRHFKKSLFGGRDALWEKGFRHWKEHFIFGEGKLRYNWHNSAVACLVATGTPGYIAWIYMIRKFCVKAYKKIDDDVVLGILSSFLIIWLQQSVEQGIMIDQGMPIIFCLLGLMLARVNALDGG